MMAVAGYWTCSRGEQWDQIAHAIWGDENRAAELLWANPGMEEITTFSGGEVLKIPLIEDGEAENTAPWRK